MFDWLSLRNALPVDQQALNMAFDRFDCVVKRFVSGIPGGKASRQIRNGDSIIRITIFVNDD